MGVSHEGRHDHDAAVLSGEALGDIGHVGALDAMETLREELALFPHDVREVAKAGHGAGERAKGGGLLLVGLEILSEYSQMPQEGAREERVLSHAQACSRIAHVAMLGVGAKLIGEASEGEEPRLRMQGSGKQRDASFKLRERKPVATLQPTLCTESPAEAELIEQVPFTADDDERERRVLPF